MGRRPGSDTEGRYPGLHAAPRRSCSSGSSPAAPRATRLLAAVAALVAAAFVANLALGAVRPGFAGQPVSHIAYLWSFLGMALAGLAFALAGGCPGRQLFLAGEGDADAGTFVLGTIVGAALAHDLDLAAVPDRVAGGALVTGRPGPNGQIAVVVGLVLCVVLGLVMRERAEPAA